MTLTNVDPPPSNSMTTRRRLPDWAIDFFAGAIFFLLFFMLYTMFKGFDEIRKYGAELDTGSWIQHMPTTELLFYGAYLFLLLPILFWSRMIQRLLRPVSFRPLRSAIGWVMSQKAWKLAIVWFVVGYLAVGAAVLWITRHTPLTDDEYVYTFQAEIMAKGRLWADSPHLRQFYDNIFLINDGRIYGQYALGNSLLETYSIWILGTPYGVAPVAGGMILVLLFLGGEALYSRKTGMIAAALGVTSPLFLHSTATLQSHPPAAVLLGCCWLLLVYSLRWPKAWIAGLAAWYGACALGTRWVCAAFAGWPLVYYVSYGWIRDWERHKRQFYTFVLVGMACLVYGIVLYFLYTGQFLTTSYETLWSDLGYGKGGFGKYPWGLEHTFSLGLRNLANAALRMNFWLLGWPVSLVLAAYVYWPWKAKRNPYDYVLLLSILSLAFVNIFYYWPGVSDTGPVTYFIVFMPLLWLTARGVERLVDRLSASLGAVDGLRLAAVAILLLVLAAVPTFHYIQVREMGKLVDRIRAPYELVEKRVKAPALVFTDYYLRPSVFLADSWVAGRKNPSVDFNDEILYVRHISDEEDQLLIASMPNRRPYRLESDFTGKYSLAEYRPGKAAPASTPPPKP